MLDTGILDVAIGLLLVYVLVSTLCSAIREGIEARLKTRAAYLEHAIRELLDDAKGTGLARQLFEHPLIYGLYQGGYTPGPVGPVATLQRGGRLPSYISAQQFALALMDIARRTGAPPTGNLPNAETASPAPNAATAVDPEPLISFQALRQSILELPDGNAKGALLVTIDSANGNLEVARHNIEAWYDGAMERVSGWYKRSTQRVIFATAFITAAVLNVNTLTIAEALYRDKALRESVVESAKNSTEPLAYDAAKAKLEGLGLPIGWERGWGAPTPSVPQRSVLEYLADPDVWHIWNDLVNPLAGLLMTAFAATLGAPFWFDLMSRFITLRSTLKPDERKKPAPPQA